MRHLIFCSLLLACGGEPFSGDGAAVAATGGDDSGSAGDGGDGAGGIVTSGGSVSLAGAPAGGAGAGGSGRAGAPSGGQSGTAGSPSGGTGGGVSTCALDTDQLTAALPSSFVWESFTNTNGEDCVTCRESPCGTLKVISWGVPDERPDGELYYLPNVEKSAFPMNFGANDGACTKKTECGISITEMGLQLFVERDATGWVASAQAYIRFGPTCSQAPPSTMTIPYVMGPDFSKEASASLNGLKIPCPG